MPFGNIQDLAASVQALTKVVTDFVQDVRAGHLGIKFGTATDGSFAIFITVDPAIPPVAHLRSAAMTPLYTNVLNFLLSNVTLVQTWMSATTPAAKWAVVKQLIDNALTDIEQFTAPVDTARMKAVGGKVGQLGDGHLITALTNLITILMPLIQQFFPKHA